MLRRPAWLAVIALAITPGVAIGDEVLVSEPARPWLGISYDNSAGTIGLMVSHVFEESAAMACGLRDGDEIVEIDGELTPPGTDLRPLIESHAIDDRLSLRVYRGERLITLKAVLAAELTDGELLHVQLVGRRAPTFDLQPLDDLEAPPIDDSVLVGKVGVVAWFHSSCMECPDMVNKLAPWLDKHPGVVGLAGVGGPLNFSPEQRAVAVQTILRAHPVSIPVGLDQEGWFKFGAMREYKNTVAIAVIDRQGMVTLAAAVSATDGDAALDDVFAAGERALKQRKPHR